MTEVAVEMLQVKYPCIFEMLQVSYTLEYFGLSINNSKIMIYIWDIKSKIPYFQISRG